MNVCLDNIRIRLHTYENECLSIGICILCTTVRRFETYKGQQITRVHRRPIMTKSNIAVNLRLIALKLKDLPPIFFKFVISSSLFLTPYAIGLIFVNA